MKANATEQVAQNVAAAMTSRRQFLRFGVVASAMLGSGSAGWAVDGGDHDRDLIGIAYTRGLALERFVFDTRFAESTRAARVAAVHGIRLAPTSGDLTSLWYHDLDLRWKRVPMALAGVTTRGNLFVLETLAADRGMRIVHNFEHPPELVGGGRKTQADSLYSWIIAPRFVRSAAV